MGWPTAVDAGGWMRKTERRIGLLERRPTGGGGSDIADPLITVQDTATLDLTLTGDASTGYVLKGDVLGGAGGSNEVLRAAGEIFPWSAATDPLNALECNGQAVSRTTYATLFAKIGTTYGVGDNSTTFNVPNLKGRTIFGKDAAQTEFDVLGETGGTKTHTHRHLASTGSSGVSSVVINANDAWLDTTGKYEFAGITTVQSNIGGAWAANTTETFVVTSTAEGTLPPYLTLRYFIQTRDVLSGTGTTTVLAVQDTPTLDLTLTGNPSTGYTIKGDVIGIPPATTLAVTDTATLDLTLTGSPATGYTLKGDVLQAPTSLTVTDTATLDLTLTGTPATGYTLKGDVLTVPTFIAVQDSATVDLTLTGTQATGYTIKADVLPAGRTAVAVTDTTTVDMTLTGDAVAGYSIKADVLSIPPALVTVADTATLDMTVSGAGTVASPLVIKGDVLSIPSGLVTVTDSTTVDLTASGSGTAASPRNITASVIAIPPALVTVADTTSVDMTISGAGTAASPLVISAAVLPAGKTTLAVTDTPTLDLTLTGDVTAGYTLKGDVLGIPNPTTLAVTDTPTLDLTLTGNPTSGYVLKGDVLGGGTGGSGSRGIVGEIIAWPLVLPPADYLIADGSAVSRTTYSDLFALIGTYYGVGDNSTTFNLPNLVGKVPFGYDAAQTEFSPIGKTGGAKSHRHAFKIGMPFNYGEPVGDGFAPLGAYKYSTSSFAGDDVSSPGAVTVNRNNSNVNAQTSALTGARATTGDTDAPAGASLPPYITLNYAIRYRTTASVNNLAVTDSSTVDLTLTGDGSPVTPYTIKADVISSAAQGTWKLAADQAVASGVFAVLGCATAIGTPTPGVFSNSAGAIQVLAAGVYEIRAQVKWSPVTSGSRRYVSVTKNTTGIDGGGNLTGGAIIGVNESNPSPVGERPMQVWSYRVSCVAGDILRAFVFHDAGVSMNAMVGNPITYYGETLITVNRL